ncbi:MAG: RluA family pseudouridine synthase [Candidatus Omnitrophica bacterium]|nr:RluA family pseudouridine synthase [Candidatus Omnitrophota bacterium]
MQKTIEVLYDDDCLVVFNKPSGLLVIPSPKKEKTTLTSIVNDSGQETKGKWHPCHRLDRDASGLIIFAKGKKRQQLMMREFKENAVEKKYIAFVRGQLEKKTGEIAKGIKDFHQNKFARHSMPKKAVTRYRVLKQSEDFSVVEVQPVTGRTNQIRIHFSDIGHPLLGECVYAFRKDFKVNFRRLALHALSLTWQHPELKKKIEVSSLLPEDMKKFLKSHSLKITI